jgi:FkbM family methyltransferase
MVGASGRVYGFEPIPHTFSVLRRNVSLNGCVNVTLESCALADSRGERDLYLPDIGVSGSLELHPYDRSYERIPCLVQTLDGYCQGAAVPQVDFLKSDIEGAEWLLLKGGEETIRRWKPVMLLEIQAHSSTLFDYTPADIFDWLGVRGYSAYYISGEGQMVPITADVASLPDYNFLFVPDGKQLLFRDTESC